MAHVAEHTQEVSMTIAVVLWPLVLFGVSLHIK